MSVFAKVVYWQVMVLISRNMCIKSQREPVLGSELHFPI